MDEKIKDHKFFHGCFPECNRNHDENICVAYVGDDGSQCLKGKYEHEDK